MGTQDIYIETPQQKSVSTNKNVIYPLIFNINNHPPKKMFLFRCLYEPLAYQAGLCVTSYNIHYLFQPTTVTKEIMLVIKRNTADQYPYRARLFCTLQTYAAAGSIPINVYG